MPAHTTVSPETLIETAKAPIEAYNDKDWDKVKSVTTSNFVYDEVATNRRVEGIDKCIELWKGWAKAFPDSRGTVGEAIASGDMVALEVTWRGTHKGELNTPAGTIPATGKKMDIRACALFEVKGDKVTMQRHFFDMMTMLQQLGVAG